jgi:hypothetical protein
MSKRTDNHRVGAIIPEDYEQVLSYSLATTVDGWPVPSFGVNCELDRRERDVVAYPSAHDADGQCCVVGLRSVAKARFAEHGGTGKCTVCGANFVYGEVWRHKASGEHVNVGHICGRKYGLLADRGDFDVRYDSLVRRTAAQRIAEQNAADFAAFCSERPGLADALAAEHPILKDMAYKLRTYKSLSDKQVAFALKLADEVRNPKPAERHVRAPTGKTVIRGRVVSVKNRDSIYGTVAKMTVKVETPDGTWLAWGTCPSAILDATARNRVHSARDVPVVAGAPYAGWAVRRRSHVERHRLRPPPSPP